MFWQEASHNGTTSSSGQLWSNVTSGKQGLWNFLSENFNLAKFIFDDCMLD